MIAHKEKMIKRRAEQYARKSRIDPTQVAKFVAYWKNVNRRNGVGRKPNKETEQNENV